MSQQIKLSGTAKESIVDGVGIRYTIFTQGCPHNCKGCHNPQTHDYTKGYYQTVESLFQEIKLNPLLRGITLSGGEPFSQAQPLIELVKRVKEIGKDVWAYSGYTYEELQNGATSCSIELLELIDVLVDGQFQLDKRDLTLKFKGNKNQRIIDCNKTKLNGEITLFE